MSAELLAGIVASPDDTELRLVHADWLEEHGELDRATFIRTECALAGVPKYDPRWIRHWVWAKDHPHAAPRPPLPEGLQWHAFAFDRGLPSSLRVHDVDVLLDHAPAIFGAFPIRALDIDTRPRELPLERLLESPWLAGIRRLRFQLGEFDRRAVRMIVECEQLGALAKLAFEFAGITVEGLQALFEPSPVGDHLQRLNLRHNWFGVAAAGAFAKLAMPRLERLNLEHCQIGRDLLRMILERPHPRLAELVVADNPLEEGGWRVVASAPLQLRALDLSRTRPGVAGVRALLESEQLAGLHVLRASRCRLGVVAARAIAKAPWRQLRVLDLGDNDLGDGGVRAIMESAAFPDLVHCSLHGNGATDDVARRATEWSMALGHR